MKCCLSIASPNERVAQSCTGRCQLQYFYLSGCDSFASSQRQRLALFLLFGGPLNYVGVGEQSGYSDHFRLHRDERRGACRERRGFDMPQHLNGVLVVTLPSGLGFTLDSRPGHATCVP
ncbi:unnamed protein product [Hapterophycus canaliculatus]